MSLPLRLSVSWKDFPSWQPQVQGITHLLLSVPEASALCIRCLWLGCPSFTLESDPWGCRCCCPLPPWALSWSDSSVSGRWKWVQEHQEQGLSPGLLSRVSPCSGTRSGFPSLSLSSLEHEGSGAVVKLNHMPMDLAIRGTFQLPYNLTTRITAILVWVYKYTCSVTFMTLGNKGHGNGLLCMHPEEGGGNWGESLEELWPNSSVIVLLYLLCNRLARKAQSGTRKNQSLWILKINLNTVLRLESLFVSYPHIMCPFLVRPHY